MALGALDSRSVKFLTGIRKGVTALMIFFAVTSPAEGEESMKSSLRLTILVDNEIGRKDLKTAWGFSCLVEGLNQRILFDTGPDDGTLLYNMKVLGVDPKTINAVFLSHHHGDHTGGLADFLRENPHVTVFLPASFSTSWQKSIRAAGAEVTAIEKPVQIFEGIHSTGEMGTRIKEQGLVLETPEGLVVLVGCAHPGIAAMVRETRTRFGKDILLAMGGFHLGGRLLSDIRDVVYDLRKMGVRKVAPCHCTGNEATRLFRELWGKDFIEGKAGAVIFPLSDSPKSWEAGRLVS